MAKPRGSRRVLIIVENLPVPFDRRVWQEALTLRDAGYRVTVICPATHGFDRRFETLDGIAIHRHPMPVEAKRAGAYILEYAGALFWETWLAWKIFFTGGFDIVQGCNPPDTIFLVAFPFKLFGRKYVFDQHDLNPELYEAKFGRRGWVHRALTVLERWSYRVADAVLTTNASHRERALDRGGAVSHAVTIVRNGPDLARLRPMSPDARWKGGKQYLVVYVGVMGTQEGIDGLLRVARALIVDRGRTDVRFVLAGDGTELESLRSYARDLGIARDVEFTGRLGDADLIPLLNTADVCVAPDPMNALNDASTMLKTMEYMAIGKPIVQYALTEGRVTAGESSLYAEPGNEDDFADKLIHLLDHPDERSRLGVEGRRRVEETLGWERQAPHLLEAYDRLFEPPAR